MSSRTTAVFVDLDRRDDAGVDAVEFTRLVRERKPDVDIIAIAATPSATITMDVIATGALSASAKLTWPIRSAQ